MNVPHYCRRRDGSERAKRILSYLANKMAFPNVHVTHEPRRHSQLGKLALSAVSKGEHTPLEEAGLFAADRVDHLNMDQTTFSKRTW